jgi:hypothetical protein
VVVPQGVQVQVLLCAPFFSSEIYVSSPPDALPTQDSPKDGEEYVSKWLVKVKHWNKVFTKIHRPCTGLPTKSGDDNRPSLPRQAAPLDSIAVDELNDKKSELENQPPPVVERPRRAVATGLSSGINHCDHSATGILAWFFSVLGL